jgi:membrane protein implicated in regulation of membrane protease activity
MPTIFWIWMIAAVIFLIIELATPTLIFACFVAASVAAGVYGALRPDSYYLQIAVFIITAVVLLPFSRRIAEKLLKPSPVQSNVDRMIGHTARVTRAINPDQSGQVEFEGDIWLAVADEPIDVSDRVEILSVSGTRVHVRKVSQGERIKP